MRKNRIENGRIAKSEERLKKRAEFDRIFRDGKRVKGPGSRLIYAPNAYGFNRFAICPVKKYGHAVDRNRAKRVTREAYWATRDELRTGYDLVLVLYPGTDTFEKRKNQISRLFRLADLFR